MLLPHSSCVCISCFKSVAPQVCLAKVPFLAFFGNDMKPEMGVVIHMYLNIPQTIFISNIYGFMGLTPLVLNVFAVIPYLTVLSSYRQRKRYGQWNPAHVTLRMRSYMHTKF